MKSVLFYFIYLCIIYLCDAAYNRVSEIFKKKIDCHYIISISCLYMIRCLTKPDLKKNILIRVFFYICECNRKLKYIIYSLFFYIFIKGKKKQKSKRKEAFHLTNFVLII